MKKFMMMLAAILCCAMTTTVFTSCGSDEEESTTPPKTFTEDPNACKKVMANFCFFFTEDMMNNCDILVTMGNETETVTKTNTTKVNTLVGELYKWEKTVAADALPAQFVFSRQVTLKNNIDAVTDFAYTICSYDYNYSLYNAEGKKVKDGKSILSSMVVEHGSGAKVTSLINEGKLNKTVVVTIESNYEENSSAVYSTDVYKKLNS